MSLVRVDVIRALSEHKLKAPCEVSAKAGKTSLRHHFLKNTGG